MSSKRKNQKKSIKKTEIYEPKTSKKVKNNNSQNSQQDSETEVKENKIQQNNTIFSIKQDKQILKIQFGKRQYSFDMKNPHVQADKHLSSILQQLQKEQDTVKENFLKNQNHKIEEITKITDHYNFSALEYYIYYSHETIDRKNNKIDKKCEDEKCCICQFELYDNILEYGDNLDKFNQQLLKDAEEKEKQQNKQKSSKKKSKKSQMEVEEEKNNEEEDQDLIVGLSECDGHFFHKNCLLQCIQEQHIKCPVCSRIYGIMTGDQPDGEMEHYISDRDCSGFEGQGSIVINYSFDDFKRNGKYCTGTYRTAYLPNNKEGQECLKLLKTAFDRRLIFTVGRSVTTGQENTTVWNGVHHKTNYGGGAAYFGYPDATYFNRLKLELAMKGVY